MKNVTTVYNWKLQSYLKLLFVNIQKLFPWNFPIKKNFRNIP